MFRAVRFVAAAAIVSVMFVPLLWGEVGGAGVAQAARSQQRRQQPGAESITPDGGEQRRAVVAAAAATAEAGVVAAVAEAEALPPPAGLYPPAGVSNVTVATSADMIAAVGDSSRERLPSGTPDSIAATQSADLPKVTVSCVTCAMRQPWHELVQRMVDGQLYAGQVELIMLDSPCAKSSSKFGANTRMINTSSFTYIWFPSMLHSGDKRGRIKAMASGDVGRNSQAMNTARV